MAGIHVAWEWNRQLERLANPYGHTDLRQTEPLDPSLPEVLPSILRRCELLNPTFT